MPRSRLAPADRRRQLLDCALAVFARRGLGEARHAEIAKDAGVSTSTVFVYFPTRDELVDAVLGEVDGSLTAMAERIHGDGLAAGRTARDVIRDHVLAFAAAVDEEPERARVWLDWSTAVSEEVTPRYLEFQERMVALIRATIERGQREGSVSKAVDADGEARLLVGSAHMLAQMKLTAQPAERVDRFIRTLIDATLGVAT